MKNKHTRTFAPLYILIILELVLLWLAPIPASHYHYQGIKRLNLIPALDYLRQTRDTQERNRNARVTNTQKEKKEDNK